MTDNYISMCDLPLSSGIAILLPIFCYKLGNRLTGYNSVNNMCNDYLGSKLNEDVADPCWKTRENRLKTAAFQKHLMMIVLGAISILTSSHVSQGIFRSIGVRVGFGWGGFITILTAMGFHWSRYNELQKLFTTGACLVAMIVWSNPCHPMRSDFPRF